ncbi:hypothetical protein [Thermomonas alba]|uniref:hypothetical protein n=1 Tax=Thermomonas alba TaxID=2888525 RepID=UPI001F04A96C|nr:hypothetical protein [Thermomonas alba]
MNRKLHNSLMAALTSSALLISVLLVSTSANPAPVSPAQAAARPTPPASVVAMRALTVSTSQAAIPRPRHSLRMPFFSFSPRS